MTVYSVSSTNNADMVAEVVRLYVRPGAVIADVTWGKGAFWRRCGLAPLGSDLSTSALPVGRGLVADLRHLPYRDHSIDIVVLDPPYVHNPGQHVTDGRYNNAATTKGMYHDDIIALYVAGMTEGRRVMRGKGSQLWVKCKDEVESGRQRWSHIELHAAALGLGFFARDLFVLAPTSRTTSNRWARQVHARKVHSYLWVFEKR